MMMMIKSSGLDRLEVTRQRELNVRVSTRLPIVRFLLPFGVATTGLTMMSLLINVIVAAVVLTAGLVGTAAFAFFMNRLAVKLDQTDTRATVIRDGLYRVVNAQDLAIGDSLVVRAGDVLPVDGDSEDFVPVRDGLAKMSPDGVVAGMTAANDALVTVTANGDARWFARLLCADVRMVSIARLVVAALHAFIAAVMVSAPIARLTMLAKKPVIQAADDAPHEEARNGGMVAKMDTRLWLSNAVNEFRYNQVPAS